MADKYCEHYFYPENHRNICRDLLTVNGKCNCFGTCPRQLHLNKEEHAILDNLRIVKMQNEQILAKLYKQK